MDQVLDEKSTLKAAVTAIRQKPVTFEIDVVKNGKDGKRKETKRSFTIRPLTVSQLHRISALILDIDISDLTANGVFRILKDQLQIAVQVLAIAVTDSRKDPSKKLIDLFFHNLNHADLDTALKIVFQQMEVLNFINTMASIRTLNVLEKKAAGVQNAGRKEVSPQVPGSLQAM